MCSHLLRSLAVCSLVSLPCSALAVATINEVMFDPVGKDNGLEWIELYNPTAAAVDLSGWELYPDGVGYFTFPAGFSLNPMTFVSVHLRASGANDSSNLYHAATNDNMGNSSGSIALFRTGGRSSQTIVDFVRYRKPDTAEQSASKTWESAAVSAGLWSAGTFVDITSATEGGSIGRTIDGAGNGAAAWQVLGFPPSGNVSPDSSGAPPSGSPSPPSPGAPLALRPTPSLSLDVEAGPDATLMAGAAASFEGLARLSEARFLWNFGDGTLHEGRVTTHVYRFPGRYRANLTVQSGEFSGSDWRTITVVPAAITLSEAMPGRNGFVEITSSSDVALDLGGVAIVAAETFYIPLGTVLDRHSSLVFANIITGFDALPSLELRDASGNRIDAVSLVGALPLGGSWERIGEGMVATAAPTPGSVRSPVPLPPPSTASIIASRAATGDTIPHRSQSVAAFPSLRAAVANREAAATAPVVVPPPTPAFVFAAFAGAVALGGAAAFFFLKRRFSSRGTNE